MNGGCQVYYNKLIYKHAELGTTLTIYISVKLPTTRTKKLREHKLH